jgi:hypothetical protein
MEHLRKRRALAVGAGLPAGRPAQIAARVVSAGAGRVRGYVGPLTWGLTMPGLLLTGVALCAALIMMAALLAIRHRRRSKGRSPAPAAARVAAAGPTGNATAPHEIAIVPGFSETVPPGPGAQVPVPPGQAAHPRVTPTAGPQPDPHGPGRPPPNGQRTTARAPTTSEQIASYYDQADKPLADYLTALGWIHQPHSRQPPGPAERARRHPPSGGPDSKARAPDGRPGTHRPRIVDSAP